MHNFIQNKTEDIQREFHELSRKLQDENPKLEYQDVLSVFIFKKLAELQLSIHVKQRWWKLKTWVNKTAYDNIDKLKAYHEGELHEFDGHMMNIGTVVTNHPQDWQQSLSPASEEEVIIPHIITEKNRIITRAMTWISEDDSDRAKEIIHELSTLLDTPQISYICPHSGEAFNVGDDCYVLIPENKTAKIEHVTIMKGINTFAYFHTKESAQEWQGKSYI